VATGGRQFLPELGRVACAVALRQTPVQGSQALDGAAEQAGAHHHGHSDQGSRTTHTDKPSEPAAASS
jgi:hypothetical protein